MKRISKDVFLNFFEERTPSILFGSAIISVSLFQFLNVLYLFFALFRRKFRFDGNLRLGVTLYSFSTLFGTTLFNHSVIVKAFGEAFLPFLYFWSKPKYDRWFIFLLPAFGVVYFVFWAVKFYFFGEHKVFWGGPFRSVEFFSIFSLSTFILSLNFRGKKTFWFVFSLGLLFLISVFLIKRRSFIIGVPIVSALVTISLLRNGFLNKRKLYAILLSCLFFMLSGMGYLIMKDERFEPIRKLIKGDRIDVQEDLNTITSYRFELLQKALDVIQDDIKNKRVMNILFGHGIRAGKYILGENIPAPFERFESFIFVSEIVERGVIGLLGEVLIWFHITIFFIRRKVKNPEFLIFAIPISLHLFGSIFRPFWNTTLPLYLFLFRLAEEYSSERKDS